MRRAETTSARESENGAFWRQRRWLRWQRWRAIIATLVVLFLAQVAGVQDNLNRAITDRHHRVRALLRRSPFPDAILIVAVDDRLPRPTRRQFAALLDLLHEARAVGLDFLFDANPDDAEGDRALAAAVRRQGHVAVGLFGRQDVRPVNSQTQQETKALVARLPQPSGVLGFEPNTVLNPLLLDAPFPALRDAAAALGYVDVNADRDNIYRAPILVRPLSTGEAVVPHLTVALAALATGTRQADVLKNAPDSLRLGTRTIALGSDGALYLQPLVRRGGGLRNSRGGLIGEQAEEAVGIPAPMISIADALTADPSRFHDKVVLIGQTTTGSSDIRPNPLDNGLRGVELNAEIMANLLHEREQLPAPLLLDWLLIAAAVGAPILLYDRLSPWKASVWALIALIVLVVIMEGLFWADYRIPTWSPVLIGWVCSTLLSGLQHLVLEDVRRHELQAAFSLYVAPELVTRLVDDPAAVTEAAQRRRMAILFSDIRGFTPYSESHPTEQVVRQMEEYLTEMTAAVFAHQGFLDKFIGDAVMALFNPLAEGEGTNENWSRRAVECALEMLERLERLNRRWEAEGLPPFRIGIGVHTGEALFGNIGAKIGEAQRIQPTALGNAVNFAARLQAETKEKKRPLLVSEIVRQEFESGGASTVVFEDCGEFVARGQTEVISIFAVSRQEGKGETNGRNAAERYF